MGLTESSFNSIASVKKGKPSTVKKNGKQNFKKTVNKRSKKKNSEKPGGEVILNPHELEEKATKKKISEIRRKGQNESKERYAEQMKELLKKDKVIYYCTNLKQKV